MIGCRVGIRHLLLAIPITIVRKPSIQWRVNTQQVPEHIPRQAKPLRHPIPYPHGPHLSKSPELRPTPWPTLQPDNHGGLLGGVHDIVVECPKQGVKHAGAALGVEPVYLLVA